MPFSLPPTPPQPPLPRPPSSTTIPTTSLSSSSKEEEAARVRVLVRVRPHNQKELDSNGPIGRSNVLTIDNRKSNQCIDFGMNSDNSGIEDNNNHSSATITVRGINNEDTSYEHATSSTSSSGLPPITSSRRLTGGNNIGYNSDGESNNMSTMSSSYSKQFTFDAVHGPRSTQCEVYGSVKGIVDAVAQGYNGTIVAYGQTGSGKTHTVFGDETCTGLVQRSLRDIFQKITLSQVEASMNDDDDDDDDDDDTSKSSISSKSNKSGNKSSSTKATFYASFFEIFNERVFDLLANENKLLENKSLAVREDATNGVYVEGLKEKQVTNTAEAEALLIKGMSNRHVASTKMNRTSSRSHAVFVLRVRLEHLTTEGLQKIRNSKFTLVDLAGSERQKSTDAYGSRLKEASMINKSLTCLGQVINALVDKEVGKSRHVPFRDSKLTFLLRDTWGGNSKTCLVATVSPSGLALSETISTLKFAQRAKLIKNNAVLNEDTCGTVAALQAEVAKLRSVLSEKNSGIINSNNSNKRSRATVDAEIVAIMKRRAEKAERKLMTLEKQVNQEKEMMKSLKRKLQGETMARKFKERRLDYLQTKRKDDDNEDQIQLLKEEIMSLQKKLETPSQEAIEWKVAYEELKEELENTNNDNTNEDEELKSKNEELEATVERLCNEKTILEEKLNDIIQSSNETRDEIESMINEVDRLEKEMNSLQNELDDEKAHSEMSRRQADEAQSKVESLNEELGIITNEKINMEFEWNVMKTKLSSCEAKMEELSRLLEQKQSDLIEMETLSRENELELQCTIEELEKDLTKSKNKISEQIELEQQTQTKFNDATSLNKSIKNELHIALNEVQQHQKTIKALEEKVSSLTNQNNSTEAAVKRHQESEAELNEKVVAMSQELVQLRKERENLEQRLSCVKKQSELTAVSLEEKTEIVHLLQDQIVKLKEGHVEEMKLSKEEKHALERKVSELEATSTEMSALQTDLESKQQQIHELRELLEKVTEKLASKEQLQAEMDRRLQEAEKRNTDLNSKLIEMKDTMAKKESYLNQLNAENDITQKDTIKNYEKVKIQMEQDIKQLITERAHNLSTIQELQHHLEQSKLEVETMRNKIESIDNQLTSLRHQNEALLGEKLQAVDTIESKLKDTEMQLNIALNTKKEIEEVLEKERDNLQRKEREIAKLLEERDTALCSVRDYEKCVSSLQQNHTVRLRQLMEEKDDMQKEVESSKQSFNKASDAKQELEIEIKELQSKLDSINDSHLRTIKKMEAEYLEKESSFTRNNGDVEAIIHAKDIELSELEKSTLTLKNDYSQLKKKYNVMKATEEDIVRKLQTQRDRVILLQREKGQMEFERENLREDYDKLNEQFRAVSRDKDALSIENEALKRTIENMKVDIHFADSRSSGGSTYDNDSRLSYDNVSTAMDSMLGKMSSRPIQEEECVAPMEESFDESMFLPTTANDEMEDEPVDTNILPTPSKLDYGAGKRQPLSEHKQNRTPVCSFKKMKSSSKKPKSSTKKSYSQMDSMLQKLTSRPIQEEMNDTMDESMFLPTITYDEKENEPVDTNILPTPSKLDYGVGKRQPLSERKQNRTPLRSTKKMKSSSKKPKSSTKKSYMMFNNKVLFGEKM